ncbi:hypothetical protein, partial [Luteimicrobium xylanilyticum]|uniref:hypothetical protein n=1 Tax=Luteimicrobium xylanilyticum TaxID=1133546 RepID=UPI003CD0903C
MKDELVPETATYPLVSGPSARTLGLIYLACCGWIVLNVPILFPVVVAHRGYDTAGWLEIWFATWITAGLGVAVFVPLSAIQSIRERRSGY